MDNIFDAFDDDLEVLELIEMGNPRQIYARSNFFDELSDFKFFQRFRLTKPTVLNLLEQIEEQIEFASNRNQPVSPINQLLTTLRLYSTGGHLSMVADYMGMHTSTACRIVKRISRAIASLYRHYVKMPGNPVDFKNVQNNFYEIARFPRVLGAVDGTHIRIESPGGHDAEIFRNRKDYFSINVQGICNADMEFVDVVARWPGSAHDVTIFNNSNVRAKFENGHYRNGVLLGDSGYNARPYLLTPLLNPRTNGEQLYNEAHIRTRNVIERVFGVWKRRFPILAYGCRLKLDTVLDIIIACSVLHNIARRMGEEDPPLPEEINQHELQLLIEDGFIPNGPVDNNDERILGNQMRRNFINNYFERL